MLNFLKAYFDAAIQKQQSSIIEQYIASKNPLTVADVEHWEKQFSRTQNQGWVL
jgi:hypothetical protein